MINSYLFWLTRIPRKQFFVKIYLLMLTETTITVKEQKSDAGKGTERTKGYPLSSLIAREANFLSTSNHMNSRSQFYLVKGRRRKKVLTNLWIIRETPSSPTLIFTLTSGSKFFHNYLTNCLLWKSLISQERREWWILEERPRVRASLTSTRAKQKLG